jgi:hypothetical protein
MRYYPAGLSRTCPEDERGWHQGAAPTIDADATGGCPF